MSVALRILSAGPGVTIQDGGRHGYLRYGVTGAGPMDRLAFSAANLAAGRADDAAALEISLGGVELAVEGGAVSVAVVGGDFNIALDGRPLPPAVLLRLDPDSKLRVAPGQSGSWCYAAISAHIDLPPTLGSLSTHTRSGLGGLGGRALRAGDLLPLSEPRVIDATASAIETLARKNARDAIRVILGPQDDYFAADQIEAFLNGPWTLSARSDRMAYLLEGAPLKHAKGFNIVSDGIALGAIQVLGDGKPIVLMADRQPTGGYPKIATVIGADIGSLAQLRPGASLRFAAVSVADAVAARRAEKLSLERIVLKPIVRTDLSSATLLSVNLIGGITAGTDPEESATG